MFDSVGHAWHIILVTEAPHVHIHGSTGLVCLGIVNYESFELVWEADDSVRPIIERGLL